MAPEKENSLTHVEKLRFSTGDVTKLIVFIAGMMFQYFSFKSEIHDALSQQGNKQEIANLRIANMETAMQHTTTRLDWLYEQQPAIKPEPIKIINDKK